MCALNDDVPRSLSYMWNAREKIAIIIVKMAFFKPDSWLSLRRVNAYLFPTDNLDFLLLLN